MTVINGSTVALFVTFGHCMIGRAFPRPFIVCPVISRPSPVGRLLVSMSQPTTMADQMAFLLFGDQSLITHDCLAEFFAGAKHGILCKSFLEQTASALQRELDRIPKVDHREIPPFASIQELNERYDAQARRIGALDSALLCITQLALYFQ